ncbi:MAG: hypothetical protein RIQ89_1005 [Bacteroidota bacterium]
METNSISLFQKLILALNLVAAGGLLLSYCASYISPGSWWILSFFGLAFGTLLSANMVFIVWWILSKKKFALISIITIVIGLNRATGIYQLGNSEVNIDQNTTYKIMSWNVRNFDLYNWLHSHQSKSKIFNFLQKENAAIVCFQEYFTSERPELHMNNRDSLKNILNTGYSHISYQSTVRQADHFGLAIYSKFPIVNKGEISFEQKHGVHSFQFADLKINSDTVRLFNIHLESIRFKREDYKFIENIGSEVAQNEVGGVLKIFKRLKKAFIIRSQQIDEIAESIATSPFKVIVCGDFNDTPTSYTYHQIADGLKDGFREAGSGWGKTYIGAFPSFRIDYLLFSRNINLYNFKTNKVVLSDHYPISCYFSLPD